MQPENGTITYGPLRVFSRRTFLHRSIVGRTTLDFVYDNGHSGYACGFNSQGDVEIFMCRHRSERQIPQRQPRLAPGRMSVTTVRSPMCRYVSGRVSELASSTRKSSVDTGTGWHYQDSVLDTFYVLAGSIRIYLQDAKEKLEVAPGQSFAVPTKRPHLVTNAGNTSAVFLVLQGVDDYDFVPLT
jgi:mannose-6-phosphate isomerase-like protein (cupin superfamily)